MQLWVLIFQYVLPKMSVQNLLHVRCLRVIHNMYVCDQERRAELVRQNKSARVDVAAPATSG